MEGNLRVRIVVEAFAILGFAFAAWYTFHPELDIKRFESFRGILPVKMDKANQQASKWFGCIYAMIVIIFVVFLIRDIIILVPWF